MKHHYFAATGIVLLALSLFAPPLARADVSYGDGSSATLTAGAWKAYNVKNYKDAIAYTSKCIESYKTIALTQQKNLASPHATDNSAWALNDVATCYYVQGMAKEGLGKAADAMADYKYLIASLDRAQCQDAKGFSWSPAKAAKDRLGALLVDNTGESVITKIDLDSITVKTSTAVSTYRISPTTKVDFKGQPTSLTAIQIGMSVVVTTGADATEAESISASDPPSK